MAALLLCAATAVAVQQLTPARPVTNNVLVAARDLPAGHTLVPSDLMPAAVSPAMVPDGTLTPPGESGGNAGTRASPSTTGGTAGTADTDVAANTADGAAHAGTGNRGDSGNQSSSWVGRQVSGPVRRGEVMTDAALLGDELLIGAPPGSQAVPLRLADPSTVRLLRQGQLVNVVLSSSAGLDGPTSNDVLARSVPVLWTPDLAASSGGLLPSQETDGLVVVAATAEQASLLAGASARGKVFLVLVN